MHMSKRAQLTGIYQWNPMPHIVDIRCPECGGRAEFEFAEVVRIRLKKDVDFFKKSKLFEYRFLRDRAGTGWHAAFYFLRVHGRSTDVLDDLPAGYSPADWNHSRYLYRSHGHDWGTVDCFECDLRRKHVLSWPDEAFYQIVFGRAVLWAFHRESAVEIRDFIVSVDRDPAAFKWRTLLVHLPKEFLAAKARDGIVKRLDRLLVPGVR